MHAFQRKCQGLDMICAGSGDNEPEGHLGLPFNCRDGPISLRLRLGQAGPQFELLLRPCTRCARLRSFSAPQSIATPYVDCHCSAIINHAGLEYPVKGCERVKPGSSTLSVLLDRLVDLIGSDHRLGQGPEVLAGHELAGAGGQQGETNVGCRRGRLDLLRVVRRRPNPRA
jgi:hypothetical protein